MIQRSFFGRPDTDSISWCLFALKRSLILGYHLHLAFVYAVDETAQSQLGEDRREGVVCDLDLIMLYRSGLHTQASCAWSSPSNGGGEISDPNNFMHNIQTYNGQCINVHHRC